MITLTKFPEQYPVDVTPSTIECVFPYLDQEGMCLKIQFNSGKTLKVEENLREFRFLLLAQTGPVAQ